MAVEISSIKDAKLREIAANPEVDKNGDKKLSGEEYSVFAQKAMANGATYEQISEALDMNAFERWWFDVDKVSTDGKDDGKLSAGEIAESSAKGFFGGIIKGMAKNPITTAVTIGLGAAATIATGGAALPLIIGLGAGASALTIGVNAYKYAKADNDTEAKMALEGIGTGTAGLALSATAVKSANTMAAKGGVKSLQGLEKSSWSENAVAMFKSMPEALKQSGLNIKGNYQTLTTGVIHANSNATRTGVETGYQAGNKVQDAYKVDLTGTVEEVLAKNPGLKYDAQANKYYVETSWGENMYIQNENYMYVKYGESVDPNTGRIKIDHNAVEGKEFYDTYIDHAKFEANGTKRYINPENLKPGEHVQTSKNAPARFKIVPEGTKYMSKEGEGTVQPGSVLRIDGQGRPYQSTVEFMTKKVKLTDAQIEQLNAVDPVAVELYRNPDGMLSRIPAQFRKDALPIILEEREAYAALEKMSDVTRGSIKFRLALQGGREVVVKNKLLNKMGVKLIYGYNEYNGPDPLLGFAYNGKMYSFGKQVLTGECVGAIDGAFEQVTTGKMIFGEVTDFPRSITQDGYYLR